MAKLHQHATRYAQHSFGLLPLMLFCCLLPVLSPGSVNAKDLTFALVPKLEDVSFFQEIKEGCMAAAKELPNTICRYEGPPISDFRLQDRVISGLVESKVDGIAISVINSDFISTHSLQQAMKAGIPVITFDSDLDAKSLSAYPNIRRAYVGTDNHKMGLEMARALKRLRPSGSFAVLTGNRSAPNLNSRLAGIMQGLRKSGWTEYKRSPLFLNGSTDRALLALNFMYQTFIRSPQEINAVISSNAVMQERFDSYKLVFAMPDGLEKRNGFTVVSADTSPHQISLLKEGLSDANIGQNTFEMGQTAITLLHRLHHDLPVEEINYTSLRVCEADKEPVCRVVD